MSSLFLASFSTILVISYWLLVFLVTFRLLSKHRQTSFIVAWVLIIYILPVIGIIAYFLFAENYIGRRRYKTSKALINVSKNLSLNYFEHEQNTATNYQNFAKPLFDLCKYQTGSNVTHYNNANLLSDTNSIFDSIINDINNATSSIEMVFYIWQTKGRVHDVEVAICNAQKRGVACKIILDSIGSRDFFSTEICKTFKSLGVLIVEALPVNLLKFTSRRLDIRQHRKIIIIDNNIMYTGSINIVDPSFFNQNQKVGQWVDIMVRIEGNASLLMQHIFYADLEIETGKKFTYTPIPIDQNLRQDNNCLIHLLPSGPGYSDNLIHQAILTAIYNARREITITTPYLVPSDTLLHALCSASQRGVCVNIIIPEKNNSLLVKWASRSFLGEFLKNNVNIFHFKDNLLHTKSILIDNNYCLVGTANLDMRSLWLNYELITVIENKQFCDSLANLIKSYLKNSHKLQYDDWIKRSLWQRIIERLFYFFSPLL